MCGGGIEGGSSVDVKLGRVATRGVVVRHGLCLCESTRLFCACWGLIFGCCGERGSGFYIGVLGYQAVGASDRANRVACGERYYFYSTYRMCMPIEHLRASSLAGASMKQKVIALSRRLGPGWWHGSIVLGAYLNL